MTEKLYDYDSHLYEFSAKVTGCEQLKNKYAILLDKTAFFPEGGGQESDRGTINGTEVLDVQIKDGLIYHYTQKPFTEGETVLCRLDRERRFRNMQNHSGEHILSGLIHSLYGFENIGFHLGANEMTMDFNGELTREDLIKVEYLANEAVYKNVKFTAYYPSPEELQKLEYRSKLDLTEDVRIVTVDGYDICACCAPHVGSAAEIGTIKILDFFRNKGGVRIYVKCGIDAIQDYNDKYANVLKISNLLSVKQSETAEAVQRLLSQVSDLKFSESQLIKRLIEEKVQNFNPDSEKTAIFEQGLDMKELQLYADALNKKCPGIRGVFSGDEDLYSFAICGGADKLDEFFSAFRKSLTVKGGGRNGMVQGTVKADRNKITDFFIS